MADNSTQGGTDTIRTQDRAGVKTEVAILDLGSDSAEALLEDKIAPDVMVPVTARQIVVEASFTRPSDTTAYAANDVAGPTAGAAVITFSNCARANGRGGVIVGATLHDSANQSTKPVMELMLFDTTFTPDADNAAFTPTDAEMETWIGSIAYGPSSIGDATAGASGNAAFSLAPLAIPFVCGASSRDLFGALIVRQAYTPVSAEVFKIRLWVLQY